MRSIEISDRKLDRLNELAVMLTTNAEYDRLLHTVQRSWLRSNTIEETVEQLPQVSGLLSLKPEVGPAICESFTWVDTFLKG